MDQTLAKVARKQWGLFTRDQAVAGGATKWVIGRRLARGAWLEVAPGVYRFPGGHPSWHQKVMAATLSVPAAMASHRTAAFLWRLEFLNGPPALIEVTAPFGNTRRLTLARVHHTRRPAAALQQRQGITTTPLARTLVDLSDVVSEEMLFVAFDSARRTYPSAIARLDEELRTQRAGRRNVDLLAEMTARARGECPTGSPLEARTAFKLDKRRGMPRPRRQHVVHDPHGNFIARVDFAWLEQRVILQCDSRQFHLTPDAFEKDLLQRRQLESYGWRVVHVTSLMLKTHDWLVDLERLLDAQTHLALFATHWPSPERIQLAAARARWRGPSPPAAKPATETG